MLALVAGFTLKLGVTPLGRLEADSATLLAKPFTGVIVIATVLELPPCVSATPPGEAERLKFGPETGQLLTRLVAFTVPKPVAKSQPVVAAKAGEYELLEVESTPIVPEGR